MKEHLLSLLENSRGYTLAVADAMPVKLDEFKPSNESWTFKEQLNHIAYGIEWWNENYVKGIKTAWEPPADKKNRKDAVADINRSYDALKETVNKSKMNDDVIKGFYATLDHITHHRGQLIAYLRSNNITPPEYTY